MAASHQLIKTAAETGLAAAFASARTALPGGPALVERRDAAYRQFETLGLPSGRVEDWKYTDLRTLMRDAKPLATPALAKPATAAKPGSILADLDTHRVAIVNGAYAPGWTEAAIHDPGVVVSELFAWLADHPDYRFETPDSGNAAIALNTAFLTGGVVLRVRANAKVAKPIHIAHVFSGDAAAAMYPRILVAVEPGAQVTLIESFEGPAALDYQVNTLLDLTIGAGARVDYIKLGTEGAKALHLATQTVDIGPDAQFEAFAFTTGGAVVRDQGFVRFSGEGSRLALRGARLLRDTQHVDTTVLVDHAAPHCESRELFKTVLDDRARGIFQGKIVVRPLAQKTDGRMAAHALLLSDNATADSKPELEIYADDVQCGHGATTGSLDENLKFYLMSRGISEHEAETLLIQAFVGEAVDAVVDEAARAALSAAVTAWLEARG